jgi:hypothetical protein
MKLMINFIFLASQLKGREVMINTLRTLIKLINHLPTLMKNS